MVFRLIVFIENAALPREAAKRLGPMIFWSIAIFVTAIACAALFYAAAGRTVNAAGPVSEDANSHFGLVLAGIEADLASGKLDQSQAMAAKGELAREILRARADKTPLHKSELGNGPLLAGLAVIAATTLGLYTWLGSPELPTQPLAGRSDVAAQSIDLDTAIAQIESRLAIAPDDVRGWSVIAPAYTALGRFADAADAYRHVIALSGANADLQTNLAEALLLAANGQGSAEALELLQAAAGSDRGHARSRLYLASERMRLGQYDEATALWREAIALAAGDEPWLAAARQGLSAAQNDGVDASAAEQQEMIAGMVTGLADRLASSGGSVEEWTQLVRAYIVLGEREKAQAAYDASVAAYPLAFDRGELDTIALGAGLELNGDRP